MEQIKEFPMMLSALRRQQGLSQRKAASDLNISQALLSHYENGTREPGLAFICRVCDYYGVTADYLLGRSRDPDSPVKSAHIARVLLNELRELANRTETALEELGR